MSARDEAGRRDEAPPPEDLEELEEAGLEELEGLEDEGLEDLEEAEAPERKRVPNSPLLKSSFLRDLARSFEKTQAPLAILDRTLAFVYQNPAFRQLAHDYRYQDDFAFPEIFQRCLAEGDAQRIRADILDSTKGRSWKGILQHRTKDVPARITRAWVQPLWPVEEGLRSPNAYSLTLDDVTDERRRDIRGHYADLLEASKLKDNDTGLHIQRVNHYSALLARQLYLDERWPEVDVDFLEDIGFLAAMHDVGKIGTPDHILNKTGPLNELEWAIMKEHTINGALLLSSYPNPMAREIARSHHEWWNGSGYPYNLVGTMIPLAARIAMIADVYDALRMRRSYKPAFSHETAVEKIVEDSGLHFDPDLVAVFQGVTDGFRRIYAENADPEKQ